ncbi:MAG: GTPase HflX, partial [Clostridia bacterium]|nr:GTPase HflX [Clostridia bacterium]
MENERKQRMIAAAVCCGDGSGTEKSLDELNSLVDTAGGEVVCVVLQNRESPDNRTYLGSGKAAELAEVIKNDGDIDAVVFDNELTPSQIRNLEDLIGVDVIDRTMLILDIFAQHASTNEGKLQVEIACLRYTAPRLIGKGKSLSRQGGGIGTRGPGESKLETDRRHIKRRIAALEEELKKIETTRTVQRQSRDRKVIPSVSIVGYTNSGKSTLLNKLTGAGVLAENKLFATLDPTVRILELPGGTSALLSDTVGFIDRLPHHLVKAFKSTLDELKYADLLLITVDMSDSADERARKREVTEKLISELCGEEKEKILIYNKEDLLSEAEKNSESNFTEKDSLCISAKNGDGINALLE